ncbi:peptidase m20 domain-containing protein 2 [Plakobranchus ocellatus]|uniref:Peptidase m20 domain-containing protein 2 n=1 Tax=Plakobranchus ocellatus TaxID=259542 RepID=A0AAV4DFQ0_9GAST|nr:peptidase m20 domain-containing protein 2 [Plakobranchus ocellatus]
MRNSIKEMEINKQLGELFKSIKELNTMPSLMKVINVSLCLSHGNAKVERGFSVHKKVSEDDMSKECLTVKKFIYQCIKESRDPANIILNKAILISCCGSYQHYKIVYKEKRDAIEKEKKQKEKKIKHEEAKVLHFKRRKLELDIDMLQKADNLSIEAEGHLSLKTGQGLLV